jgi:hypothetical protein
MNMDSIAQIIGYIVIVVIISVPWVIGAVSIWEHLEKSDDE